MKVSTQQTTSPTVVTISVLLLYFSQVSLLIGYQWRNKYNLDSHFETSTGKNKLRGKSTAVSKAWDYETSELMQIIAVSALSQSWWALRHTVLLQTSLGFFRRHRDKVDSLYMDAPVLWFTSYPFAHSHDAVSPQLSKEQGSSWEHLPYIKPSQPDLSCEESSAGVYGPGDMCNFFMWTQVGQARRDGITISGACLRW